MAKKVSCALCGKEFIRTPPSKKCCSPECARERANAQKRQRNQRVHMKVKSNKPAPQLSINQVMELVNDYNEKYGTRYNYGNFVSDMENGRLNHRRV